MSKSFIERFLERWNLGSVLSSRRSQLVAMAVLASSMTASAIIAYQKHDRRRRLRLIKQTIPLDDEETILWNDDDSSKTTAPSEWDESLVKEQLARNLAFLGSEGLDRVRKGFVIIVGAGGVGSWAATMLLRSGIGKLRIIDFDQVTLSSLNRHAVATLTDVGTPKVIALQRRFKEIAPWTPVEAWVSLFRKEDAERLLSGNPDFVIDAIDNIDTKVELLGFCAQNNIKVVASMGAGAKADPSLIQLSDISVTQEDPLARSVRRGLKKEYNVESGIPVVYSTEKPSKHVALLPLPQDQFDGLVEAENENNNDNKVGTTIATGQVNDFAVLPDFRVRILPVLGPIPAMFGLAVATHIITSLAEFPGIEPIPIKARRNEKLLTRMHRELCAYEMKYFLPPAQPGGTGEGQLMFTSDELGYMYDEVFRQRSIIAPEFSSNRTTLVRWSIEGKGRPLSKYNVACMTHKERERHVKEVFEKGRSVQDVWGAETCQEFERRLREEKELDQWR